ncbi:MAG: pre-mRNA cleavage complex 2 Pcf11-like [Trebouxia sp. A1-2]|nr:MAG: pre-mRNA cleavage complex 2 Pcf11-like [Trebouxia sp. A1-2]
MDYKELILQYADSLKTDLTWASKTHINMLTMLAAENKAAAASICATIERHVLSAPSSGKLPTLYLVDSILKNVKEPYISLFCRNLIQVFFDVWQQREVHPQLLKLLATWDGIFPPQLLTVLKQRVAQDVPRQASGNALQFGQAQSSDWSQRAENGQQPVSLTNSNIPSTSGRNGYYAAPHVTGRLMSASYQHPQQRQDSFQPGYAAPQGQSSQQQWQSHQAAQQVGSVQYLQQSSCQPLVLPNLLSSLLSSGLLTVPPSVSIAPSGLSAAPAVFYTHPPSRAATPEAVDPEDCKFVPSRLKEYNPAVLANLMETTAQLRSKHLDMQFMRRRRQKSMVGASRQWFVSADLWLAGTAAAAVGEGQPQSLAEEPVQEKEAASVPVDDSQPKCALSGEKFEKFWHDQYQEWRYKNAVQVGAEDAARYGLQTGALVLESTLAGTPSSSQDALPDQVNASSEEAAESQQIEADMHQTVKQEPVVESDPVVSHKRLADANEIVSDQDQQLHIDKRIKLEV